MAGFVRGGAEFREVDLMEVLPPSLKGFSTQAQQMAFVAEYEEKTGVMVRLPWEKEEQRIARRAGFTPAPPPELGGDPVRLQRSLDRVHAEIQSLTRDNPQFDAIMATQSARANKLERALGKSETVFGAAKVAKAKDPEPSKDALAKFDAFSALSPKKKRESAEATKDREFLQLIKDRESDADVVKAATMSLLALDRVEAVA